MFDEVLIESAGKDRKTGGWITALISGAIHAAFLGAIVAAGMYVQENPEVIQKPMSAFIVAAAAPPPPPPASGAPVRTQVQTPRDQQREAFAQPRNVPRDVPVRDEVAPDDDSSAEEGGVPGGVKGGQRGGVVGGDVEHGQLGGTSGGLPGGQVGATGDGPLQVGGNVKAPVAVLRVEPVYTEIARRARVQGEVTIQAVIDRHGNVIDARVTKPLPYGLDQAALRAIRQWRFRPGTLNGQPVPVYYNLTVNFRIE